MDATPEVPPSPEPSTSSHSSTSSNPERAMLGFVRESHSNISRDKVPQPLAIFEFEDVFKYIKDYGRYQLFMLLVIQYAMLNAAGNYVFISFASLTPTCHDPRFAEVRIILGK